MMDPSRCPEKKDNQQIAYTSYAYLEILYINGIYLIQKWLSSELLHCALRIVAYPDRNTQWM